MDRMGDVIAGPAFQAAIAAARGDGGMLIATGDSPGAFAGDLHQELAGVASLAGLPFTGASLFATAERATTIVKLGIEGTGSDLAVYHDSLTGTVAYQMLHRSALTVAYGSHTLALIIGGSAPDRVLDLAYGPDVAAGTRAILTRLGLRMSPPPTDEMEFECYAFDLEPTDADEEDQHGHAQG